MNLVEQMSTLSFIVLSTLAILIMLACGSMMRLRPKGMAFKITIHLSMIALFFTMSSLFWTTDIAYDRDTLKHLEFGWPISFVMQNQEMYEPPFPYEMVFGWDLAYISENPPPHQIIWKNCLASFAINFFLVFAVWSLVTPNRNTRLPEK